MAITLITTAGGATSNAYCTIAEADAFIEANIHETTWTTLTDAQKNALIVTATRLLDEHISWKGVKTYTTQRLQHPRKYVYIDAACDWTLNEFTSNAIDDSVVHEYVKNATAELARLFASEDRTADPDTKGFSSLSIGSLNLKVDKADRRSVIPESVRYIVSPLIANRQRSLSRC